MKKTLFFLLLLSGNLLYAQHHIGNPSLFNVANTNFHLSVDPGAISPATISPTTTPVTTAQWHFAGQGSNWSSGTPSLPPSDWLFSIVSTGKKEYVGCGYSAGIPGGGRDGAIMKLDNFGNLAWAVPILSVTKLDFSGWTVGTASSFTPSSSTVSAGTSTTASSLWRVVKASDGYVAVGSNSDPTYGNDILIVEYDDDGNFLNGTPIAVVAPGSPGGSTLSASSSNATGLSFTTPTSRGYSVDIDPNTNSVNNIIVGGTIAEKSSSALPNNRAFILTLNYGGSWAIGSTCYGGNNYSNDLTNYGVNTFSKIITKSTGSTSYKVYACGSISEADDNHTYTVDPYGNSLMYTGVTSIRTFDKDIWIASMTYDNSSHAFSSLSQAHYNKNNISVGGTYISDPTYSYTYNEVGPMTARNYALNGSGQISGINTVFPSTDPAYTWFGGVTPPAGAWLSAPYNEAEQGIDMILAADGNLALISMVNATGNLSNNIGNVGDFGLLNSYWNGVEYKDGDAFLLKINPSTLALTGYGAKNVGHFCGGDFTMNIKQDKNGQFIVAGGTANLFGAFTPPVTYTPNTDVNLADPVLNSDGSGWSAYIVGTNDDANQDVWRRSFVASDPRSLDPSLGGNIESTFCVFGMDTTADGGYLLVGNNNNNSDDWTVTKFAPLLEQLMVAGIGGSYNKFGGSTIPSEHDITGPETWSSNMNIASKVVVKSGGTLTINNCTISFAASDQLWDYTKAADAYAGGSIGCGIVVEPGGKLVIENNAILQGISVTGQHNMWDGIVVHGTPTAVNPQGRAQISNATIKDARYGLYVSDNYRTYYQSPPVTSAGTINGYNYSSRYNGYATYGGGVVIADHTTFLNCRFGVNFQNSPTIANNSTFTNCTFNSDATGLGDVCFYTDENGGVLPANTHFASWNVDGIDLYGNTFNCDPSFAIPVRPVGIIASATKMYISDYCATMILGGPCTTYTPGNTFTNLNNAIIGTNPPGVSPSLYIAHNQFSNNGNCVSASGLSNGLVIVGNQFGIPGGLPMSATTSMAAYLWFQPTGVTLAGCRGYDVSQNTFNHCTGCFSSMGSLDRTIGIAVNNGTVENELVNLNQFSDISYASVACQTNGSDAPLTGLQFRCNSYNGFLGIDRNSRLLGSGTIIPATLNPYQGECMTVAGVPVSTAPAGNQFNALCYGSGFKLHADASVSQVITYNNNGGGSIFDPGSCINSSVYNNLSCATLISPTSSQACPIPSASSYSSDKSLVKGLADLAVLDIVMHENTDINYEIPLQTKHDLLVAYIARYYSLHKNYLFAALLCDHYNMYRDALPFYIMAGLYKPAQEMHDKLPTKTDEEKLYAAGTQIAIDLYKKGENWMSIDSTLRDTISRIVQYNSATGYMAGGVSMLVGTGTVTWPIPVIDTTITIDSSLRTSDGNNISSTTLQPVTEINKNGAAIFSVYPNPTFGNFTILTTGRGTFTVCTMIGQELQQYDVIPGKTEFQLPRNIAPGMYVGFFKPEDGGETKEIKFVYRP